MIPILLDLFCGAGGAAEGYRRAGFTVVGIDIKPQPNYPFAFIQGDAIDTSLWPDHFDAIHASPPCQVHAGVTPDKSKHVDLIPDTRTLLVRAGVPYVIENVPGARKTMIDPIRLCGSTFGLDVRRHRYFETNWPLTEPACDHASQPPGRFPSLNHGRRKHHTQATSSVVGVHGHLNFAGEFPLRQKAMDIYWMTNEELVQSIPPAYTEYIGRQLRERIPS